jgi:hypothetical protein
LIDWVCERDIPGDFTMDCYFTNAEILNHIHGQPDRFGRPRGYVGDLKSHRKVEWKGRIIKVNELAASIPSGDRKELRIGDRRRWYFTVSLHIPEVNHTVRIVILWRYRQDPEPVRVLVTNRITWEVSRIVRVYRHRWTGAETFHRLMTIGEAYRARAKETLHTPLCWAIEQVTRFQQPYDRVVAQLGLN